MDWYKRDPQAYRRKTWDLTLAEHGAYNLLLDHYYATESPLPASDMALASICGCGLDKWLEVKDNVMRYFRVTNAGLRHDTCDELIEAALGTRGKDRNRQDKFRKRLKTNDTVPRDTAVSPPLVTAGEEKREEKKESPPTPRGEVVDLRPKGYAAEMVKTGELVLEAFEMDLARYTYPKGCLPLKPYLEQGIKPEDIIELARTSFEKSGRKTPRDPIAYIAKALAGGALTPPAHSPPTTSDPAAPQPKLWDRLTDKRWHPTNAEAQEVATHFGLGEINPHDFIAVHRFVVWGAWIGGFGPAPDMPGCKTDPGVLRIFGFGKQLAMAGE